jgi:hypothetical protein
MALLMVQERRSGSGLVIFVSFLFSCSYGTQVNEFFTKSKRDHLMITFFFVLVSPIERCNLENFSGSLRVTAVDF